MMSALENIRSRVQRGEPVWLFLDYDGTLSEFAPNPDVVEPNQDIIDCIQALSSRRNLRVSIISGRRLEHIQKLVPVSGILLAGTYGIELQSPQGDLILREDQGVVRPVLEEIKPGWSALIAGKDGFYLEDKGWSLAIHARFAAEQQGKAVLAAALAAASDVISSDRFRILGGDRFLEVGPSRGHKGQAVRYLLDQYPFPGALLVYVGDDDKDEEAFEVIRAAHGIAVQVAQEERVTFASERLENPGAVLEWLQSLISPIDPT